MTRAGNVKEQRLFRVTSILKKMRRAQFAWVNGATNVCLHCIGVSVIQKKDITEKFVVTLWLVSAMYV